MSKVVEAHLQSTSLEPQPVTQSARVPPKAKPRTKHQSPEPIESSPYAEKGRKESDKITSNNRDPLQFNANDKYSPGEAPERIYHNQNERQRARQRPGSNKQFQQTQPQVDEVANIKLDDQLEHGAERMKPKPSRHNRTGGASIGEKTPLLNPHPAKQTKTRASEMTEDGKAHSNSVPEGGITNKAYLNRGEEKEKNEEGKDKGQKEISQGSTGLAFSGGGIRSAAFCSGVLRTLLESEVEVDYLSCVSGGGYTGTAYLDWKYHEDHKEQKREWHKEFFEQMKQKSGYICDCTSCCGGFCDTVYFVGFIIINFILPVISWAFYAFPVANTIDVIFGKLMRQSQDCDAALERQREAKGTTEHDNALITRCLSGSGKLDIAKLFISLFSAFIFLFFVTSKLKRGSLWLSPLLLIEYSVACILIFTFIPFTIYDFFVKIPVLTQVFVGIVAVIVWVGIPFLRRKTSYVTIVYFYSFVIYWKVFRVDLPVFFISHEDHLFHWLLSASGMFLFISSFFTNCRGRFAHGYNRPMDRRSRENQRT